MGPKSHTYRWHTKQLLLLTVFHTTPEDLQPSIDSSVCSRHHLYENGLRRSWQSSNFHSCSIRIQYCLSKCEEALLMIIQFLHNHSFIRVEPRHSPRSAVCVCFCQPGGFIRKWRLKLRWVPITDSLLLTNVHCERACDAQQRHYEDQLTSNRESNDIHQKFPPPPHAECYSFEKRTFPVGHPVYSWMYCEFVMSTIVLLQDTFWILVHSASQWREYWIFSRVLRFCLIFLQAEETYLSIAWWWRSLRFAVWIYSEIIVKKISFVDEESEYNRFSKQVEWCLSLFTQ